MWIKQLHNHKVWYFAMAFGMRKLFGTFKKRAPGWRSHIEQALLNFVQHVALSCNTQSNLCPHTWFSFWEVPHFSQGDCWSQTSVEMAFSQAVAHTIGFTHRFKSDPVMTMNFKFDEWIFPWGRCSSLFTSLLQRFALSSQVQFKICYGEEFDRCKIHCIDKIWLELATFE